MSDVKVTIRRKSLTSRMVDGIIVFDEAFTEEVRYMPGSAASIFKQAYPNAVVKVEMVVASRELPKKRRFEHARKPREHYSALKARPSAPTNIFDRASVINDAVSDL